MTPLASFIIYFVNLTIVYIYDILARSLKSYLFIVQQIKVEPLTENMEVLIKTMDN